MNQRLLTETQRLQTYAGLDDDGYRLDKYGKAIAEKQDAKSYPAGVADGRKLERDAVLQAVKAELNAYDGWQKFVEWSEVEHAVRARLGEK